MRYSLAGLDLVDDEVNGGKKYQVTISFDVPDIEAFQGEYLCYFYFNPDIILNFSFYQEGMVGFEEWDPESWQIGFSEEELPFLSDKWYLEENTVTTDLTDESGTLIGYSYFIEAGAENNEKSIEYKIFFEPNIKEIYIGGVLTADF